VNRRKVRGGGPGHRHYVAERRSDYLTEREIEKLMDAARTNRWGHRDATAILIAYRHGLRASELVALRWDDIDFRTGKLHVRRAKGGMTSVHPLGGKELRALRRLQRGDAGGLEDRPRLRVRAPGAAVSRRLPAHGCSGWRGCWLSLRCPQPHAAAQLRLQAGQRRTRYADDPALPRPPLHCFDGALYGPGARSVQRVLEGLETAPAGTLFVGETSGALIYFIFKRTAGRCGH
jgi:integrase